MKRTVPALTEEQAAAIDNEWKNKDPEKIARYGWNSPGPKKIIPTPELFVEKAREYVEHQRSVNRPATITGMALYMGFSSKATLFDYAHNPEFAEAVRTAKSMIEEGLEEKLISGQNIGGVVFTLSQNWHGWTNPKYTVQHEGQINHNHTVKPVDWSRLDDDLLEEVAAKALPAPRGKYDVIDAEYEESGE